MNLPKDNSPFASLNNFFERLSGTRFLTFSILFHIILLALCGGVYVAGQIRPPDFPMVGIDRFEIEEPKDLTSTQKVSFEHPPEYRPTGPVVGGQVYERLISTTRLVPEFQTPAVNLDSRPGASAEPTAFAKLVALTEDTPNMKPAPGVFHGRVGAVRRDAARVKAGGKDRSEKAVLAGLNWLKANQSADGSWAPASIPAMTGLAVLCFLGHGELPESPDFGPTVKQGIDWLITKGVASGGDLATKGSGNTGVYEHAIAAYALGEYYGMTQDARVKDVLVQAVRQIVEGQAPDGGWQYAYAKGPDSDTSVAGWQLQALKAAHLTGLDIPGVDAAMDKSMVFLQGMQGPNGGFGYRHAEDRYSLSGVGVLCTYFWKGDKDRLVRQGVKFILDRSAKENPVKYRGEKADLYAWYYQTQACMMYGSAAWQKWNGWFQDEIAGAQSPNGSWPPTGNPRPIGGLELQPNQAGPFYRTTLCILMLEVFYRYLPAYQ